MHKMAAFALLASAASAGTINLSAWSVKDAELQARTIKKERVLHKLETQVDREEALKAAIARERTRARYWREIAGQLSCKFSGIGPSGGFCLPRTKKAGTNTRGNNFCMNRDFAKAIAADVIRNGTVIDLGCGRGQYGHFFKANFPKLHWAGYDGSENIEYQTDGFVQFVDLSDPTYLGATYDWSMSIVSILRKSTRYLLILRAGSG